MNGALHGGEDGGAPVAHDFSSNASPLGPPPTLWRAVQQADRRHYPDPAYRALRNHLAAAHDCSTTQVLPASGGTEAIRRLTLAARLEGCAEVWVPAPGFGDYALAAQALDLPVHGYARVQDICPTGAALVWACDPCNPTGALLQAADWATLAALPDTRLVVDQAYAPLCLDGTPLTPPASAWRLVCPNKALGLTGVRAAYLLAPEQDLALCERLLRLAPSWVLSAEGQALLTHWPGADTATWLADARAQLRAWGQAQQALLQALGWACRPSSTNFCLAQPPAGATANPAAALRRHGVRVRDAASFGLAGWLRLSIQPPASQQALAGAWQAVQGHSPS
ncbi:MAG: aminotransferase [Roseateles depolymerans]|uniref:Aminotransferase n=1 Tax=Roseateles depolymerans TaxID=76731 RepID=A0A2W5DSJ6_9BURK|nr:MAG: aminotransferase [Roseateles depolymerans]